MIPNYRISRFTTNSEFEQCFQTHFFLFLIWEGLFLLCVELLSKFFFILLHFIHSYYQQHTQNIM